jgi:hypothetical protein
MLTIIIGRPGSADVKLILVILHDRFAGSGRTLGLPRPQSCKDIFIFIGGLGVVCDFLCL